MNRLDFGGQRSSLRLCQKTCLINSYANFGKTLIVGAHLETVISIVKIFCVAELKMSVKFPYFRFCSFVAK